MLPATASGTSARPVADAVIRIGASRSLRAPQHERRTEGLALLPLEVLEVADHQDPVARGDPEHGQEPDQRAERQHAVAEPHGQHAAHQGHRQQQEGQRRQAQAAEGRLQQQEDRDRGGDPERAAGGPERR